MVDLTTLEGADTPGKVRSLCAKAMHARSRATRRRPRSPRSASTPTWSPSRSRRWRGTGVHVARASPRRSRPAAPRSRSSSPTCATRSPPAPTRSTWSSTAARSSPGATGRSSTRSSRSRRPSRRPAHLKVILETGELATLRQRAPRLVAGDARRRRLHQDLDRQGQPAATLPVTLVMLEAVRDFARATGEQRRRQARRRHPHHARTRSATW